MLHCNMLEAMGHLGNAYAYRSNTAASMGRLGNGMMRCLYCPYNMPGCAGQIARVMGSWVK
jgi:hypothetical protein